MLTAEKPHTSGLSDKSSYHDWTVTAAVTVPIYVWPLQIRSQPQAAWHSTVSVRYC